VNSVAFNSGDSRGRESLSIMPWIKTVEVPKEEAHYTGEWKNMSALRAAPHEAAAVGSGSSDSSQAPARGGRWNEEARLAAKIEVFPFRQHAHGIAERHGWIQRAHAPRAAAFLAYNRPCVAFLVGEISWLSPRTSGNDAHSAWPPER
jgi:hypothetical protein